MQTDDKDDEFELLVDQTFSEQHVERLRESGKANAEPQPYETEVQNDAEAAFDEVEGKMHAREVAKQQFGGLRETAKANGQSLASQAQNYVEIEKTLRQDPARGLAIIGRNLGLSPAQMAKSLQGMASASDGGRGEQRAIAGQEQADAVLRIARRDIPEFGKFEDAAALALESGKVPLTGQLHIDVLAAYQYARQHPELVAEAAAKAQGQQRDDKADKQAAAVARAKAASRSVGGNSTPGTRHVPADTPRRSYEDDIMADVAAAYDSATGA